ncbi:PhzF family phenazine biosynthesis protein [Pseudoduganella plicata]|uniref:Isomerase n=1 Tax=Pseudoduganella plicata TaxID=321984 RepID=A0A4P7BFJ1_9BURK|nr:PhzF family phenazine biosynthesis protein [Pseudoduganella plicata]QBQ36335.1 PhzF family phenazine biosynthesis protein [Pseudoduganella plicata]GGY76010.1 putative isomerase [Pseudoduganella plicata]
MTRQLELLCFGTRPGEGNAALVLLDDGSNAAQRQALAAASGVSACVFIDVPAYSPTLDFYYPHMRSPLCVHATLAAARVLLDATAGPLVVRTALRGQTLTLHRQSDDVYVELASQPAPAPPLSTALAARLIPGIALASTPAIASVGSPKLLLEVRDSAALEALRPDLAAIHAWGKEHGIGGCYAWCRRPDGALEGRNFNHLDAAHEDSATGVAAGALTVFLGESLRLYQGAHLGKPCLLRTVLERETLLIGGAVEYARRDGKL